VTSGQQLSLRGAVADVLIALADRVRHGPNRPSTTLTLTTPDPDSAEGANVRTLCVLPTAAVPLHSIEVCKYLDDAGEEAFCVRSSGAFSRSEFLGTLEAGKLIGLDLWPE
jgi:hypothetical protein